MGSAYWGGKGKRRYLQFSVKKSLMEVQLSCLHEMCHNYELISFKSLSSVLTSASSTEIKQNNPNFDDNAGIGQARNWEIFLEGML